MAKTIVGLYEDKGTADQVVRDLQSSGFKHHDIQIMGGTDKTSDLDNQMTSVGIPEDDAQYYAEGIRRGGVLISVESPDKSADQAADIMDRYNPINVDERADEWRQSGWQSSETTSASFGADRPDQDYTGSRQNYTSGRQEFTGNRQDEGDVTLPVTEEELQVGKRQVQTGGLRIHTRVDEKPVEETVNLRKENVQVDRQPVDRLATDADMNAFREGSFEVTETSEQPVVSKEARVVEEVRVHKDVENQQETVRDTVRHTDVNTEDLGQQWSSDSGRYRAFDNYEPSYRQHFQNSFQGKAYDEYRPAYHYGYDLASSNQYQGRDWNAIEPEVRRDWEQKHPGSAWNDFKGAIQEGWRSVTKH